MSRTPMDARCRARRPLHNIDRRHHLATALAERFDRSSSLGAVFAAYAGYVVQQLAIEVDLLGVHRNSLQTEVLDQLAQWIRPYIE